MALSGLTPDIPHRQVSLPPARPVVPCPLFLPDRPKAAVHLLSRVRLYDRFSADNDPYGERDFGSFECYDVKCFWKIDYFNLDLTAGSEDPSDPTVTIRVVTILRADEY